MNATQCEIAAKLLGFSYANELDLDNVQPLRSASSCKFCGSCNAKTVSMANDDGNETVSICQWRYHGSNQYIYISIQKLDIIILYINSNLFNSMSFLNY